MIWITMEQRQQKQQKQYLYRSSNNNKSDIMMIIIKKGGKVTQPLEKCNAYQLSMQSKSIWKSFIILFLCALAQSLVRSRTRTLALASLDKWPGFFSNLTTECTWSSFREETCWNCNSNSHNNYISKFLHLSWRFDSIRGWFLVVFGIVAVVAVAYFPLWLLAFIVRAFLYISILFVCFVSSV